MAEPTTRTRRSEEDRIAALEAQIAQLKARAEAKKVKKDPSLRHISAAARSIDKALSTIQDTATKAVLVESRTALGACLSLNGVTAKATNGVLVPRARPSASVDAAAVLAYVTANPGARGEHIAAALGTDTTTMRPVMHKLIDERKVKTKGERRGMQYFGV